MKRPTTTTDALTRVETLIAKGWCQRKLRNGKGEFCIVGATQQVCGGQSGLFFNCLDLLRTALPYGGSVVAFNDRKGRTQAEMVALVRRAKQT
jgi:hypothetical protein